MNLDYSTQFCERIDNVLHIIRQNSTTPIDVVIDNLCSDICFWDSNAEISRNYLVPLKSKSRAEVVSGLEYVKSKFKEKGNPFFHRW